MEEYPVYGDYTLDHYFKEDLFEKITSKKFKMAEYRKRILLQNVQDAPETPDLLLEQIIRNLIDEARHDKHKQFGHIPDKYSMMFRSELLESPIQVLFQNLCFSDFIYLDRI